MRRLALMVLAAGALSAGAAPDRASIHNIGRFIRQGLVRTLAVIEDKVFRQTDHQFAHRGVTLQIHVLVLNGAPEPLDEDVVKGPPRPSALITTPSRFSTSVKAVLVNCEP